MHIDLSIRKTLFTVQAPSLVSLPVSWVWASLVSQSVKTLPAVQDTQARSLGQEDPLEKGIATHSSILAWRIPWTEEPGRLYSPWCPTELDMTEWLTLSLPFFKSVYLCQFFRLAVGVKRDSHLWLQTHSTVILYNAFAVTLPHLLCDITCASSLSYVWLFVTLWTVTHQAPLSMKFSRHGYWNG